MDKVCKGCLRDNPTYDLCDDCQSNPTMIYVGINPGFECGIGAWRNRKPRNSYTPTGAFTEDEFHMGFDHAENFIKEICRD